MIRALRLEEVKAEYLAAEDKLNFNIKKTTRTYTDPNCRKPPNPPIQPRDPFPGNFQVSTDLNEIVGPVGAGPAGFLAGVPDELGYTIRFENLGPGSEVVPPGLEPAEIAAARVTVITTLDDDVDPATFELGDMGFAGAVVDVPPGLADFETRLGPIDDPAGTGGQVLVDAKGSLDPATRGVTWVLEAIDPETGLLVNDERGLLPPEPEEPEGLGQGFVEYKVDARDGSPSGAVIEAVADIVFDDNDSIFTNTWTNTLDDDLPSASIGGAPSSTTTAPFTLGWDALDPTSAPASYDLLVRIGDGAFIPLKEDLTETSASVTLEDLRFGEALPPDLAAAAEGDELAYGFAVVATDQVGNRELPPLGDEALVTVDLTPTEPAYVPLVPARLLDTRSGTGARLARWAPRARSTWT